MSDAFEYFTIQRHTWQEWVRVVVGLFLLITIIPAWFWVMKHRKDRNE